MHFAHAAGSQGTGERVGPGVQLRERQRSELVDQSDSLTVADRGRDDRAAELAEAFERSQRRESPSGGTEAEHARTPGVRGGAGLVSRATGEPCPGGRTR